MGLAFKQLDEAKRSFLEVALDVGYESHAAVTRVLFSRFGASPKTFKSDIDELEAFLLAVIGEWLPKSDLEVIDGSHVQRIWTAWDGEEYQDHFCVSKALQ